MRLHANAKLGPTGRRELVLAIERGMTLKQAAACFSVSPATAHRWWHRWLDSDRSSVALLDRSSRPHRQPRRLTASEEEPILRARPRRTSGRAVWPGSAGVPARQSGRCSGGTDSREDSADSGRATAAMSGRGPARSCIWTSRSSPASMSPATAPAGCAQNRSATAESATTTCTASSTTTRASPMSSSTHAKTPRRTCAHLAAPSPSSASSASIQPKR
jgi:hypothetical protein